MCILIVSLLSDWNKSTCTGVHEVVVSGTVCTSVHVVVLSIDTRRCNVSQYMLSWSLSVSTGSRFINLYYIIFLLIVMLSDCL